MFEAVFLAGSSWVCIRDIRSIGAPIIPSECRGGGGGERSKRQVQPKPVARGKYRGYMWAGDPAAHSGYMRAGGSGGCMGARGPAAYLKSAGSTAYSRHVGEGVQLLTVDMWGRGSNCLQ